MAGESGSRPGGGRRERVNLFGLREEIPRTAFVGAGIAFPVLLLILWFIATSVGWVRPLFLPSPVAIVDEGVRQVREGILVADASVSIYRILMGWLAATVLAVPLGVMMGSFRIVEGLFEPFIATVRYMPVVALIPLSILWAGIGDFQKILILFLGTFFQQVLMVTNNVKTVDMNLLRVGQTLGFSNAEILRRIVLPASMPGIWDTFRITIGWTWTYLVVGELVAANEGLGRRIMDAQRYLATDTIIFGALFIGVLGLMTDYLFKSSGRWMFGWAETHR